MFQTYSRFSATRHAYSRRCQSAGRRGEANGSRSCPEACWTPMSDVLPGMANRGAKSWKTLVRRHSQVREFGPEPCHTAGSVCLVSWGRFSFGLTGIVPYCHSLSFEALILHGHLRGVALFDPEASSLQGDTCALYNNASCLRPV